MSDELTWFKSSYSDSEGSNCVEVATSWRKSTYSNSEGGACVEVGACADAINVRDSKLGARSPELGFQAGAWTAFLTLTARS